MQEPNQNKDLNIGAVAWFYLIPLALAVVMLGVGAYAARLGQGWSLLAAGAVCTVGVLCAVPICLALIRGHSHAHRRMEEMMQMHETRLRDLSVILNVISEQQLLSDRARAVAYREKDREVLRRAIQEEMARKDFEAAMILVNDIEAVFGYKQEADRFRQEIDSRRNEVLRQEVNQISGTIDQLCRDEKWDAALAEAQQIGRTYPNDSAATGLANQVQQKRANHKQQLLETWRDALKRSDTDGAIEILKKLDTYLTASEAAEIQEDARGVFRQRLKMLSEQFGEAVHQEKIPEAIGLGETIIRDFPNTRIAQEIRERMDVLKQRAVQTA